MGQHAELLVDPQADVGGAGQQRRIRVGFAQQREVGQGLGRVEAGAGMGVVQRVIGGQGAQCGGDGLAGQPAGREVEHLLAGIEDGPVAGAAAEVAGQVVRQLLAVGSGAGLGVTLVAGGQRHHEAGGAEAALRAVAVHQGLLHRAELLGAAQVFHRQQRPAVQRGQELGAGVHVAQLQFAVGVEFALDHRAGATVALGAAFLGAGAAGVLAQVLQDGRCRRQVGHLDDRTTVKKAHRAWVGAGVHSGPIVEACLRIAI